MRSRYWLYIYWSDAKEWVRRSTLLYADTFFSALYYERDEREHDSDYRELAPHFALVRTPDRTIMAVSIGADVAALKRILEER